jgi:hypothetical protein
MGQYRTFYAQVLKLLRINPQRSFYEYASFEPEVALHLAQQFEIH